MIKQPCNKQEELITNYGMVVDHSVQNTVDTLQDSLGSINMISDIFMTYSSYVQ